MKTWFSASELAGLPGMPTRSGHIPRMARAQNWISRPRVGRGGGREYSRDSLPAATQSHLCDTLVYGDAFSDRMTMLVERAGSAAALARMTGVSESVVRKWRNGESDPSRAHLIAIAKGALVDLVWLATGEGAMEATSRHSIAEPGAAYGMQPHAVAALGEMRDFVLVPHYDVEASAGPGRAEQREAEIGVVAFRKAWLRARGVDPPDAHIIRVVGDSMQPELPSGALVLFDSGQERLGADGIYVLMLDGDLLVKRLQRDMSTGGVIIRSANPAYCDQQLTAERAAALHIIGRVIWAAKEL